MDLNLWYFSSLLGGLQQRMYSIVIVYLKKTALIFFANKNSENKKGKLKVEKKIPTVQAVVRLSHLSPTTRKYANFSCWLSRHFAKLKSHLYVLKLYRGTNAQWTKLTRITRKLKPRLDMWLFVDLCVFSQIYLSWT